MQPPKLRNEPSSKKGWFGAIFLVLGWLFCYSLVKDLAQVRRGFDRIEETKKRLVLQEEENLQLKKRLRESQTQYFVEKIIRDKLNMQKSEEIVVILPQGKTLASGQEEVSIKTPEKQNWEKWLDLVK